MIGWTLLAALALAADPSPAPMPTAALAGCWTGGAPSVLTATETWMGPTGGMMVGALLGTTRDGKATWEQLRIEADGEGWVMVIVPMGQAETRFALTEHSDKHWVFANPTHDFPKTIRYERRGAGLRVTATGGPEQVLELSYERCSPTPTE